MILSTNVSYITFINSSCESRRPPNLSLCPPLLWIWLKIIYLSSMGPLLLTHSYKIRLLCCIRFSFSALYLTRYFFHNPLTHSGYIHVYSSQTFTPTSSFIPNRYFLEHMLRILDPKLWQQIPLDNFLKFNLMVVTKRKRYSRKTPFTSLIYVLPFLITSKSVTPNVGQNRYSNKITFVCLFDCYFLY